jgi:hypothetical protein
MQEYTIYSDRFPDKAYPLRTSSLFYVYILKVTKLSTYYEAIKCSMLRIKVTKCFLTYALIEEI